MFAPAIEATYADTVAAVEGADLLVSHQLPQTAPIVAERTGIKWVSGSWRRLVFSRPTIRRRRLRRRQLRQLIALHPVVGRAFNQLAACDHESLDGAAVSAPRTARAAARGPSAVRRAAFAGVCAGVVLGLFAARQPDYPPQTVITGFPFYDSAPTRPLEPGLLEFLDAGDPPVVFTLGSSAVWIADDFYPVSIAALRALGRRALLLVGENASALRAQVPASVGVFDYAPHTLVMPRASVIVHQGGIGTTGQALRAGRPTLVVPFGQDQPDNARRVVQLGVGRTIPRSRYTADRLIRELSLLAAPPYEERARAVGARIAAERGVATACDAIEKQLRT